MKIKNALVKWAIIVCDTVSERVLFEFLKETSSRAQVEQLQMISERSEFSYGRKSGKRRQRADSTKCAGDTVWAQRKFKKQQAEGFFLTAFFAVTKKVVAPIYLIETF